MNALKFSISDAKISIFLNNNNNDMKMTILNSPLKIYDEINGIPMEYENIIFEPFFKLSKPILKDYKTLDFGIGLKLVENIISKHSGKISLFNITDYSDITQHKGESKVCCPVTIPLVQNAA